MAVNLLYRKIKEIYIVFNTKENTLLIIQNCWYWFFVVNGVRDLVYPVEIFLLPHEQLKLQVRLMKASSLHGTLHCYITMVEHVAFLVSQKQFIS